MVLFREIRNEIQQLEAPHLMTETKEELKKQLSVLTGRRERMQKNIYEVEKEITEINKKLTKLKN